MAPIECMPSDNAQCENDHKSYLEIELRLETFLSHAKRALKDQSEVSHHLLFLLARLLNYNI